jgi:hypothetical protein
LLNKSQACEKHKITTVVQNIFFKSLSTFTMSSKFSTPNWLKERTRQGRALFEAALLVVTSSFDPSEIVQGLSLEEPLARLPSRERTENKPVNITITQSLSEETEWMSTNIAFGLKVICLSPNNTSQGFPSCYTPVG